VFHILLPYSSHATPRNKSNHLVDESRARNLQIAIMIAP